MNNQSRRQTQIQRTPRIIPTYPEGVLQLEDPARPSEKPTFSWLTLIVPPLAMLTVSIFSAILINSTRFMYSMIGMTLVTVIISILNYSSSVKKHHTHNKNVEKKYLDYLFQVRNELNEAGNQQREAVCHTYPSIEECTEIVKHTKKQLWERTSVEVDFLTTRLGVGVQTLALQPVFTPKTRAIDENNPLEEIAVSICSEMNYVKDIPVVLSLQSISTLGFFGPRSEVREVLNAIITQVTTHHGYDDVRLVALLPDDEMAQWEWIKWLPHTWNKDKDKRFIATNVYDAADMAEELLPLLRSREQSKSSMSNIHIKTPHYLFLILAPELWENSDIMPILLDNNQALSTTSIFISERIDLALPLNCQVIFEIKDKMGMLRKDALGTQSDSLLQFIVDKQSFETAEIFSRYMAPLHIKSAADNQAIPSMVTFLESFKIETVEEFNVLERWTMNRANRSLQIPLGTAAAGKTQMFDMHEKSYGPHGLVAGTTGSGKSELLQSLLLGLSVNYHPHEVAFVLIDYKGGGMANAFQGIPHLVGTITNLGGNEINRALASIKSELLRRQRLFSEADVTNIDDYIPLYREKSVSQPLPHLILVVDEFAELKSDQPNFMKELVSAARVGRSLGIHLILATQKPSGVVDDQIWSNSRFKLCLKVQTASDSQEMLKRPEAAEIKEKGRGYLQVGNNEVFSLFQSSWSGAPYSTGNISEPEVKVNIVSLTGKRTKLSNSPRSEVDINSTKKLTQLQAVIHYITEQAKSKGITEAFQLWLPPLPEVITLDELRRSDEGWDGQKWNETTGNFLSIPIGLVDDPSQQSQYKLEINFGKEGHLLVYGAPSSGKTMLLKTIIVSMAYLYSPEDVNFYVLDFGTRTFGVFNELPHLADILYPEDEDKTNKLFAMVLEVLDERKKKFSKLGISNLLSYRNATGEKVPALFILLDNYLGFSETYQELVVDLAKIVREGGNYGIYFISTANAVNSFPYRLSQNVRQALVYQMAEKSDYNSIVGRTEGLEPAKVVGRGLVKDHIPLEFQTALPCKGQSDDQIADNIRELCLSMKAARPAQKLTAIEVVPTELSYEELSKKFESNNATFTYPIALDCETVKAIGCPIGEISAALISHTDELKGEDLIASVAFPIAKTHQVQLVEIAVFGSRDQVRHSQLNELTNINLLETAEQLTQFIGETIENMQYRKSKVRELVLENDGESEYVLNHYPLKLLLLPDLKSCVDQLEEDALFQLERIARFGHGLGVILMCASEADTLSKLTLISPLTSALLDDGKLLIIAGGKLSMHPLLSTKLTSKQNENERFKPGETVLLMNQQQIRAKLVSLHA